MRLAYFPFHVRILLKPPAAYVKSVKRENPLKCPYYVAFSAGDQIHHNDHYVAFSPVHCLEEPAHAASFSAPATFAVYPSGYPVSRQRRLEHLPA